MMSELDERLNELFPLSRPRQKYENLDCDTISGRHGPTDAYGVCPWCGKKSESKVMRPRIVEKSETELYYDYHYNPDGLYGYH